LSEIKFYLDTHIAKAVAVQLRARGVDVVRCEEVGMAEADDPVHLEYAAREGRVLVSQDDDFAAHHAQWQREGKKHSGIMLLPKRLQSEAQISFAVTELATYHALVAEGAGSVEDDIANQLIYLKEGGR
jgi:predicted nuclease of predicted toxin-antitoxin system